MDYSKFLVPTLRENPAEAEVVSHTLMYRAGLIRKLSPGVYTWMPAGLKSLRKVENIVREEMDRAGAQEILMPAVQPAELWQESGRWNYYGKELLRFKDRHDRECCLGPTHEEVVTDLVRREVRSYRQLPINLYQIQTKFRDEIRPRFGVMRGREFIMKDAYSFDSDDAGADASYAKMKDAYSRIFKRCGLKFVAVDADTGTIGGSSSHEFMVLADSGEDDVAACPSCGYGANVEKAEVVDTPRAQGDAPALSRVDTPNQRTIDEISAFLKVSPNQIAKTLVFETDKGVIAVMVRGDHEVNEAKVKNLVGGNTAELAGEAVVREVTGAPVGFAGPVGIKCPVYLDNALKGLVSFVTGANQADSHYLNVSAGRDFTHVGYADLRSITPGDACPRCSAPVTVNRGIEVGHIFKLGTKYSEAMKATFLDAEGVEKPCIMGCYGIGVGRTMASAIEQNHDANGIVWPVPLAPFEVVILPLTVKPGEAMDWARKIEAELADKRVEVLFDDRDERPGVKFKDADLIGIPLRITIGERGIKEGLAEVKERASGAEHKIPLAEVATWAKNWVAERKA